jgi:hypothetical protein
VTITTILCPAPPPSPHSPQADTPVEVSWKQSPQPAPHQPEPAISKIACDALWIWGEVGVDSLKRVFEMLTLQYIFLVQCLTASQMRLHRFRNRMRRRCYHNIAASSSVSDSGLERTISYCLTVVVAVPAQAEVTSAKTERIELWIMTYVKRDRDIHGESCLRLFLLTSSDLLLVERPEGEIAAAMAKGRCGKQQNRVSCYFKGRYPSRRSAGVECEKKPASSLMRQGGRARHQ